MKKKFVSKIFKISKLYYSFQVECSSYFLGLGEKLRKMGKLKESMYFFRLRIKTRNSVLYKHIFLRDKRCNILFYLRIYSVESKIYHKKYCIKYDHNWGKRLFRKDIPKNQGRYKYFFLIITFLIVLFENKHAWTPT